MHNEYKLRYTNFHYNDFLKSEEQRLPIILLLTDQLLK